MVVSASNMMEIIIMGGGETSDSSSVGQTTGNRNMADFQLIQ